jgi:hypothetical protein
LYFVRKVKEKKMVRKCLFMISIITFSSVLFSVSSLADGHERTMNFPNQTGKAVDGLVVEFNQKIKEDGVTLPDNSPFKDWSLLKGKKRVKFTKGATGQQLGAGTTFGPVKFRTKKSKLQFVRGYWVQKVGEKLNVIATFVQARFKNPNKKGEGHRDLKVFFGGNVEIDGWTTPQGCSANYDTVIVGGKKIPLKNVIKYWIPPPGVEPGKELGPLTFTTNRAEKKLEILCASWSDAQGNTVKSTKVLYTFNNTCREVNGLRLVSVSPIDEILPEPPDPFTWVTGLGTNTVEFGGGAVAVDDGIGEEDGLVTLGSFDTTRAIETVEATWLIDGEPEATCISSLTHWGLILLMLAVAGFLGYMIIRRRKAVISVR